MATYDNDLRLKEIATGDEDGTWGTSTNVNLELIGEALSYGTQDCFASDADATTTVADSATDPARSMYFKVTSSATLTATRTLTIAPNTISRVMWIENATTGSQSITISQGSGGTVTIPTGDVKVVYLDGAGAGAAVVDAFTSLNLADVSSLVATTVDINGGAIDGTIIGAASPAAGTFTTATATTGAITTVNSTTVNATTVDATSVEVTNVKAKDGTASATIADSTGVMTISSSVLTTTDINGGTIDGTTIGGSSAAAGTFTSLTATGGGSLTGTWSDLGSVTTVDINGGTIDGTTIGGATPAAGTFSTFATTGAATLGAGTNLGFDSAATVSLDVGDRTDAVHVPVGTTAERPTAAAGMFRYNTTLSQFEGYTTEWGAIGGGGTNTFTRDAFTGDGSTTDFTLSQAIDDENDLIVFNGGVFQNQDAYTVSGTTLTFDTAPANGNVLIVYSVAAAVSGNNLNQDSFSGDGSTTAFTLSINPVNENNTQVFIDGVYQQKDAYSTSGTTLTFSAAPASGTTIEVMTFTQTEINVPVDGTITPAKIASGDFYFDTDTLYIDATNNRVGIGTSSPSTTLDVAGAGSFSDTLTVINSKLTNISSYDMLALNGATSFTGTSGVAASSGNVLYLAPSGGSHKFRINNVEVGGFNSSGVLDLSQNGVYLGGTAAANLLDYYLESTFTPISRGGTVAGTGTYSQQNGTYTRIGRLVAFNAWVEWNGHTGSGNMRLSIPLAGTSFQYQSITLNYQYQLTLTPNYYVVGGYIVTYADYAEIQQQPVGGGTVSSPALNTATLCGVMYTAAYEV